MTKSAFVQHEVNLTVLNTLVSSPPSIETNDLVNYILIVVASSPINQVKEVLSGKPMATMGSESAKELLMELQLSVNVVVSLVNMSRTHDKVTVIFFVTSPNLTRTDKHVMIYFTMEVLTGDVGIIGNITCNGRQVWRKIHRCLSER